MLSSQEIEERLERILLSVEKPGRYVGGELNQVTKDWNQVKTRVALVFPDIYDIGLSNLGLAILYDALNRRPDVLAERAYAPWTDMEACLRRLELPLYALESKRPLAEFDILGFSLPYETLYTNVLNILYLAQLPLYAAQRTAEHPLIIAGGHAAYNPEPMAAFIDAFAIGEGEEVIHEIVDQVQQWKDNGLSRPELLQRLAQISGVYVPALYTTRYHPDGTVAAIEKSEASAPLSVVKRIAAELPPPLTHFIVPSIKLVHNRVPIEIMRGCTRGCRYCHAGMVNRPVRERPVEEILSAIEEALDHTGFEEVALLSLSSSDYTPILELVQKISQRFQDQRLTISLPSLRIETFSLDLMEELKGSRQGGFTLAPEAATDRMRGIYNKPIDSQQLLETSREIYHRGWLTLKLYFLIGHPDETLADVQAIADLCKTVLQEGRRIAGKRINLHVSVGTLVPKPHTPFQWLPCDTVEQIEAKQTLLKRELRGPGLKLNWTDPKETLLEAWLSRGDRRLSEVIYAAWRAGAKFDAWQDQFNVSAWRAAFAQAGIDPNFYTHRTRSLEEIFPWDHISIGVRKSYLRQEYQKSLTGELQPDCRQQCFACGILPLFADLRRQHPGGQWKCPEVSRPQDAAPSLAQTVSP